MNSHFRSLIGEAWQHFSPAFAGKRMVNKIANLVMANICMAGGVPFQGSPVRLYLHTTNACNLRCVGCARSYKNQDITSIDFNALKDLAETFPYLLSICLHGEGEPLLYPRIYDAVKLFALRGCRVSFNSNGTLFTEKNVSALIDSGIAEVNVSLDGARNETIRRNRPGSDPEAIKAGITRLVKESRRRHRFVLIGISMYINTATAGELDEFIRLGNELNVGYIRFQRFIPYDETRHLALDREEETTAFNLLLSRMRNCQTRILIDAMNVFKKKRFPLMRARCPMPWLTLSIGLDGAIDPCCSANRGCLGNCHVTPLREILTSETRSSFMRRLTTDVPPDVCRTCPWLQR